MAVLLIVRLKKHATPPFFKAFWPFQAALSPVLGDDHRFASLMNLVDRLRHFALNSVAVSSI